MRICRFRKSPDDIVRVGMAANDCNLFDLTTVGITSLGAFLQSDIATNQQRHADWLTRIAKEQPPLFPISQAIWCAPVESQEIWAAGVTYLRSKAARMEESEFSATAYDRVYAAERPELFFKSLGEKAAAHGEPVGIRRDARWSVPEPELALVLNSRGEIVGHTI